MNKCRLVGVSLFAAASLSSGAQAQNAVVRITMTEQANSLPPPVCTYVASDLTGAGNWKGSANPVVTPGTCVP